MTTTKPVLYFNLYICVHKYTIIRIWIFPYIKNTINFINIIYNSDQTRNILTSIYCVTIRCNGMKTLFKTFTYQGRKRYIGFSHCFLLSFSLYIAEY